MTDNYQVIVQNSDGVLDSKPLGPNIEQVKIVALADSVIELRQLDMNVAPQQALFKRNGNDLEVWVGSAGAAEAPTLIVSDYYLLDKPPAFVGLSENGTYYNFVPQNGLETDLLTDLEDGSSVYQSLGYDAVFTVFPLWPLVLGGGILAVAADDTSDSSSAPVVTQEDENNYPVINSGSESSINKGQPNTGAGNDTIEGGAGDDVIFSTAGDDVIDAAAGNDVIFAGNGADVVNADAGDDVIYLVGDEFASVDGGSGFDTLMLGPNIDLDFSSSVLGGVNNIEKITFIDDEIDNTLTLTEQAVIDLTDTNNELIITGNATDTVQMLGASLEGATTIDGVAYTEYLLGVSKIYIDDDVNLEV